MERGHARMAEWSKAPDSSEMLLSSSRSSGCSGTRMGAWVRIPLRANTFILFKSKRGMIIKVKRERGDHSSLSAIVIHKEGDCYYITFSECIYSFKTDF